MIDDRITIFLADDHQIVVEGIMALVAQDPAIQVVGHCNHGLEVLDKVQAAKPNVLVLDVSLPGLNGLDLCRMVKSTVPDTAVLMLTVHTNEQCIIDSFENGATGYLAKEAASSEFCEAVHSVARGEAYLGRGLPRGVLARINRGGPDPYDTLTDRERQVLQLLAEGRSTRQISDALGVPGDTVDSDHRNTMQKLNLHGQTDLIKYAIRRQIITLD